MHFNIKNTLKNNYNHTLQILNMHDVFFNEQIKYCLFNFMYLI